MKITLPDNSLRELPEGSSGYDLAKDIGPGLAKSAIAVTINGVQRDLHDAIDADASVSIITIAVSYTHLRAPQDLSTSRMPSSA